MQLNKRKKGFDFNTYEPWTNSVRKTFSVLIFSEGRCHTYTHTSGEMLDERFGLVKGTGQWVRAYRWKLRLGHWLFALLYRSLTPSQACIFSPPYSEFVSLNRTNLSLNCFVDFGYCWLITPEGTPQKNSLLPSQPHPKWNGSLTSYTAQAAPEINFSGIIKTNVVLAS